VSFKFAAKVAEGMQFRCHLGELIRLRELVPSPYTVLQQPGESSRITWSRLVPSPCSLPWFHLLALPVDNRTVPDTEAQGSPPNLIRTHGQTQMAYRQSRLRYLFLHDAGMPVKTLHEVHSPIPTVEQACSHPRNRRTAPASRSTYLAAPAVPESLG
jgi:hypothetical protein